MKDWLQILLMAIFWAFETDCIAAETSDCLVISEGQKFVFSDSGVANDALWGFIRITGGDVADMNPKQDCIYRFKKRLGPFGSATFTTFKKGEKRPLFGDSLKSISAAETIQGQSFAEGVAQLNSVRDILEREIKSAAFTSTVQTDSLYELETVSPLRGGWGIVLSMCSSLNAVKVSLKMYRVNREK